ncbi:hypothetical protein TREMEDRAFT_59519 [Tremella mesenterica DSM 1558]|uniref:uncharacterized protein n=1 Tax=Tremella mesenterica (strain ATCC 24925 / CBS 8224 / DSM 1558 / NBRC 9311 / NRRL Y-6157 / RJB 2259-6 / UBC 559-6) TaxID=578456 RepID=UPI0003F4A379|nr:uncharacterized protein TREMEDRAFT_59519 [Tremella mesenterica DSM 1558]EIW73353.1 hypothetical protein TREMEDRAFT_59519 [Tremella mesenterica DSM 1558]
MLASDYSPVLLIDSPTKRTYRPYRRRTLGAVKDEKAMFFYPLGSPAHLEENVLDGTKQERSSINPGVSSKDYSWIRTSGSPPGSSPKKQDRQWIDLAPPLPGRSWFSIKRNEGEFEINLTSITPSPLIRGRISAWVKSRPSTPSL